MGPKKGMNSKAAAAKDKKDQVKEAEKSKKAKAEEDALWAAAGDGAKSKAQAKKDEQAKLREEAAAKKSEAKKMAAEEEASLTTKPTAKAKANLAPKMTSFQLQLQREAAKKEKEKEELEKKKAQTREVDAETYESLLAKPNTNRSDGDSIEARSVGQALAALDVGEPEVDAHPERRRKAAFEAYQEREIPILKQEKPGLKQSQYKDMVFKAWQKSPENPMNKSQQQ